MTTGSWLVADIGGTNTRVAMARGAALQPVTAMKFRNENFASLEAVLSAYVAERGFICDAACVAIAGPVANGAGRLTNLDWQIDTEGLRRATGSSRGEVLNDLQAQGHALGALPAASLRAVMTPPMRDGPADRLVIGVGTGFNIASVIETPSGPVVPPAEAGHASLPVATPEDLRLAQHLRDTHGFAAIEELLSGRGLERVYRFLAQSNASPVGTSAIRKSSTDIMADVETDPDARAAVAVFVRMLGTVAGDLAITLLPFGGVYFAGGLARAMSAHFVANEFARAFVDKGRFSGFMAQFPVAVIEDDNAALIGCAAYLANSVPAGS